MVVVMITGKKCTMQDDMCILVLMTVIFLIVISTLTFLLYTIWKGKFGLCECP